MINIELFQKIEQVAKTFVEDQFVNNGKPQVIFPECNMVEVKPKVLDDSWLEVLEIAIPVIDFDCDYEEEVEEIIRQLMKVIATTITEDGIKQIHKSDWVYIWSNDEIPTSTFVLQRTDLNIKLIISEQA